MKYKKGDKLICQKDIVNILGMPLFIKGNIYTILNILGTDEIFLDHILYGNEFGDFSEIYLDKNFINVKKLRKEKLNKIKKSD